MPSLTTHNIFAKELLNNLDYRTKEKFINELDTYLIFSQSHDLLFYYSFDLKNKRIINNLGHSAHHNKSQEYIVNIIKEIKKNNLENNHQIIAYLYGVITHYVLDTTCHPYIFYKTGVYRKKNKRYFKYRGEHTRIEKQLDAIYYEKYYNKKYNKSNISKEIIGNPIISEQLKNTITNIYKETFNIDNAGSFYEKSIKHSKIITNLIVHDPFGIKKAFYTIFDFITNRRFIYLAGYSNYIKKPNKEYLNNHHKKWNHPCIKNKIYKYSFDDLLKISTDKCLVIIKEINKVLYENKKIEDVLNIIPDLDYATGLPIKDNLKMDYFEY